MKSVSTNLYKKHTKRIKKRVSVIANVWLKKGFALLCLTLSGLLIAPDVIDHCNNNINHILQRFKINSQEIQIEGLKNITPELILKKSAIKEGDNILTLDLEKIKTNIKQIAWVNDVTVHRIFPRSLIIKVQEEQPSAIFYTKKKYYLISQQGKLITTVPPEEAENYLIITGNLSNTKFNEIINDVTAFSQIYQQIKTLIYYDGIRWDIELKNGVIIKLPQKNIHQALQVFNNDFSRILKSSIKCVVDLRLVNDKIFLKFN